MEQAPNRVELVNITKSFRGVHALKDVTFSVAPGEIHALVGENGAGKSTLMKILSGAYQRDSGEIRIDGEHVEIRNPHEGRQRGIGIIYQEFTLAKDLTVAESLFLERPRQPGRPHQLGRDVSQSRGIDPVRRL